MFITLRFGNNRTILLNPECKVVYLLEEVKKKFFGNANYEATLDFTDEKGHLMNLSNAEPFSNAKLYLRDLESYILVEKIKDFKVTRSRAFSQTITEAITAGVAFTQNADLYVPLLRNVNQIYVNYKIKLERPNDVKTPPKPLKNRRKSRVSHARQSPSSDGRRRRSTFKTK